MNLSAANIAAQIGAEVIGPSNATFERFAFDSRRIHRGLHSCFIALTTESADGHHYIPDAIKRGATVVICGNPEPYHTQNSETAFIVHPEPLAVLRSWAKHVRNASEAKILALTGSNGKTVVKEWMAELAGNPQKFYRTPGSFNSELGVPLTLCGLEPQHEAAIIEVGIDRPGAMATHEGLVQPDFGVFTTLGDAHSENFESDDQKFAEKWQLFAGCKKIATSRKWLDKAKQLGLTVPDALVWGAGEELDPKDFADLPFTGGHHFENAMSAIAGALLLGVPSEEISSRCASLQPLEMRMQLHSAQEGGYLLEDTYSSDLESLRWALEELVAGAPVPKKWAVLSHLSTPEQTARAKKVVESFALNRVWWVRSPDEVADLVAEFQGVDLRETVVLIKGQRKYRLERFAATLRQQHHSTWAEVNLGAMRRNLQKFRAVLAPEVKIMAMVKAASYGAGTLEVAKFLQEIHADYLGVAYAQEALSLRAQGITMPILVLNVEPEQVPMLATADCDIELFSLEQLEAVSKLETHQSVRFHLKINTGMNRLGIRPDQIHSFLEKITDEPRVELVGAFTHLAAADDPNEDEFTLNQLSAFEQSVEQLRKSFPNLIAHALNTHGIHRFTDHSHQMVRLGLGLYGVGSYQGVARLEPVISWRCKVSRVDRLEPGQTLGYGRAFKATEPTNYATLPVGYADGLSRSLSNGVGAVYIEGQRCPILGRVCMDMVMVDIGQLPVRKGDEVEILGEHQGTEDLAQAAGTIGYEVLTGIGPRVPRTYVKD